jgi:DNA-binding NarL/FixJ family response regulator
MESDIEVVGQGASIDDALRLDRELSPDVLLLDIGIPGGGVTAAQTIVASRPSTRIIMLTASDDEDDLVSALKAGAQAYVLKGVSARELVRIVRAVFAGERYITPELAVGLLTEMAQGRQSAPSAVNPLDELTEREREVLEGVAEGLSNKEVGQRLHLSEKTVKHYMTNILQKLHARNRVEAALLIRQVTQNKA